MKELNSGIWKSSKKLEDVINNNNVYPETDGSRRMLKKRTNNGGRNGLNKRPKGFSKRKTSQ